MLSKAIFGLLVVLTVGSLQPASAPVTILNPKPGAMVGVTVFVQGRISKELKGWPVVLVKPLTGGDGKWWVQQPVGNVDPNTGLFQGEAIFGRPNMDSGVEFAVVILLEKDQVNAGAYKADSKLETLPALPQSDVLIVTRK